MSSTADHGDQNHYILHTVEGLLIASAKTYEFIGCLLIVLKNNIKTYGFEHDDRKAYEFICFSTCDN